MDEYAVYTIFKVRADSAEAAEAVAGDALGTIPDYVVDRLEDDLYTLKAEKQ